MTRRDLVSFMASRRSGGIMPEMISVKMGFIAEGEGVGRLFDFQPSPQPG